MFTIGEEEASVKWLMVITPLTYKCCKVLLLISAHFLSFLNHNYVRGTCTYIPKRWHERVTRVYLCVRVTSHHCSMGDFSPCTSHFTFLRVIGVARTRILHTCNEHMCNRFIISLH